MNTKIYKQVHSLAEQLLAAAEKDDAARFGALYDELKALCYEHAEDEHKNHPVQWETLADFTEDLDEALIIYKKALGYADEIQAKDYMASICFAVAMLHQDAGNSEEALSAAEQAEEYAQTISDEELKRDISKLLKVLK